MNDKNERSKSVVSPSPSVTTRRCIDVSTLEQMQRLAEKISQQIYAPLWVYLHGDLGAGKTTFAQFFIRTLGYRGRVKSPTYSLMEYYQTDGPPVLHMDLYRLSDPEEMAFLGLDDVLQENPVVLVEWPEKGNGWLPPAQLELNFQLQGESRQVEIYDPHQVFRLS